jgi:hypothetical protein
MTKLLNLIKIFASCASTIIRRKILVEDVILQRKLRGAQGDFTSYFGTTVEMVAIVWTKLGQFSCLPEKANPKHLLWALLYLKNYSSEQVLKNLAGCKSEKTFRKWAETYVDALSKLTPYVVISLNT